LDVWEPKPGSSTSSMQSRHNLCTEQMRFRRASRAANEDRVVLGPGPVSGVSPSAVQDPVRSRMPTLADTEVEYSPNRLVEQQVIREDLVTVSWGINLAQRPRTHHVRLERVAQVMRHAQEPVSVRRMNEGRPSTPRLPCS
jgi:hypothetical protein